MTAHAPHAGLAELRRKIGVAIRSALGAYTASEPRPVEEALALLATDRTIHPESLRILTEFYQGGAAHREAFFSILASLDHLKVDFILNQIYAAMDTPAWLITLPADLHALIRDLGAAGRPASVLEPLRELALFFSDHFMRIFNFQYLTTRCCNAQNTSVALLKFISEKEGVHPAENWWSFEDRLNSPDRIIISLEHFKMPYTPLVYVEVALARGLIKSISRIIGEKRRPPDLRRADTAIFYSVNTTMHGLGGIALGAKMLIRARAYIEEQYPRIRRFATLSPVPRFRDYLDRILSGGEQPFLLTARKIDANKHRRFISPAEMRRLAAACGEEEAGGRTLPLSGLLRKALATPEWYSTRALARALTQPITELARFYLTREKRAADGSPAAYDPVANFHLSNGASIGSINHLANPSGRGVEESYGVMVNYLYEGGERQEANKLLYAAGKVAIDA